METVTRRPPGQVRDAIITYLRTCKTPVSLAQIRSAVEDAIGPVAPSSVRSYVQIGRGIERVGRDRYVWRG